MNHKKFLPRIAGLTLAVLFLVACNTSQLPFVSLPAPSPASIPGIDEPLVVERIRYTSYGNTYSGKLEIRIHDAYTEDSLQSGDSAPIHPNDSSDIFFVIKADLDGPFNCQEWVAQNVPLVHGSEKYKMARFGFSMTKEGVANLFIFVVPRDSQFWQYRLQLPDGREIELGRFFE